MARKAVLKRIKLTKTGKLIHRKGGQNHFNAKMSGNLQRKQKEMKKFRGTMKKKIKQYYQYV
jgi:ribosomal protein L35